MRALAAVLCVSACGGPGAALDPEVLTGSVVSASRTEIVVAADFADSATTRVRGVDGVALGVRAGDRVHVRRIDESVGKADPLDWDCRAAGACEARRE